MDSTAPAWMLSPLRGRTGAQLPGAARLDRPSAPCAHDHGAGEVRGPHGELGMGGTMTSDIRGDADGSDVVLPGGVIVRRRRVGAARVSDRELLDAARGVMMLPAADQQRIARAGVPIELLPVASLGVGNLGGPILGSTAIEGSGGTWTPTLVRVVVRSPLSSNPGTREAIGEIVQHELGHVNAVLTGQDRSEQAAERYALLN